VAKKLDVRKTLRAIAIAIQDENAERLLAGIGVRGETLAPLSAEHGEIKSRKRVRVFGLRVQLRDLHRLGIKSGDLFKDLTRRSNIKVGRTSFKIVPSGKNLLKWRVFISGRVSVGAGGGDQPARPAGGVSAERLAKATYQLCVESRNQIVQIMQEGVDGRS
jgi:hypothetical protein